MRGRATASLRNEDPTDADAIRSVIEAAFGRSAEADLVDRLRADGDAAISLVAVSNRQIVGHILFSPMVAPFRALALAPVSVIPSRQRSGVGSRLIRTGLEQAARAGYQGVFVLGDPEYYWRFGFDAGRANGFDSPYAGPHLMLAAFVDEPLPRRGEIRHAPAFAQITSD